MKTCFAYGSNLCFARLRSPHRVPSAVFRGVALLRDHRVVFHKRGVDGSGKATVTQAPGAAVYGAVFAYDDADHERLRRAEAGYAERAVMVELPEGALEVLTFVCERENLDPALRPYDWYLDLIRAGGRALGLPQKYLAQFDAVATWADPDTTRSTRERAFLAPTAANRDDAGAGVAGEAQETRSPLAGRSASRGAKKNQRI